MTHGTSLMLALALAVAPGIACFSLGSTEQVVTGVEVTQPWKDMDLPLQGGEVAESDADVLTVVYHDEAEDSVIGLHDAWLEKLKQAGHTIARAGDPEGSSIVTRLSTSNGQRRLLRVGETMTAIRDGKPSERHQAVSVTLQ